MDLNDKIWNPWHGCHECSEGCQNCYAYFLDKRYGRNTSEVVRNKSGFNLPIKRDKDGRYKLPPGSFVRVCMASDFFVEEADAWRDEGSHGSKAQTEGKRQDALLIGRWLLG